MTRRLLSLVLSAPIALTMISGPASATTRRVIDDRDRVVIHGNVRPEAFSSVVVGPTSRELSMERMILALNLRPGARAEPCGLGVQAHERPVRRGLTRDPGKPLAVERERERSRVHADDAP